MAVKKILIVGDVMLDTYHFGKVNRISPEAPVPIFLETGKEKHVPGGAANVAVNIAAIGVPVDLCSVVGADETAKVLKGLLRERNVDTCLLREDVKRRTTEKLRFIGPNNQQILRADTEDTGDVSFELVSGMIGEIAASLEEYGLFLLSDYCKGVLTEETVQAFIRLANENNIPVLIDVKDKNFRKYRNATLLKPNRQELAALTGMSTDTMEDAIAAAKHLCKAASCRYVLTTLGAEGMFLVEWGNVARTVKSVAREVYDVTGAGDTSIAYLAAELVLGKNIADAMEISNYAAGLQVAKVGTSIIYPEEVAEAMNCVTAEEKCLDFYNTGGLARLKEKQRAGCKVVFTNGCFDILHVGHITYLSEAKKLGDILVVGVNSDASVRRLKGENRPVNALEDRMTLLEALECVDYVVSFDEDTPLELIKKIEPDVLVKGGDYHTNEVVGAREMEARGKEVKILPFVAGKSTTGIIERMKEK